MTNTILVTTTFAITAAQSAEADPGWWRSNSSPFTRQDTDAPIKVRRSALWSPSFDGLHDEEARNSTNSVPNSGGKSNSRRIREALTEEYPELETLYSDAYLESVAGVPGRSISYATEHNVRRSLEWRRSYGIQSLRNAFKPGGEQPGMVVRGRCFVPCNDPKAAKSPVLDSNKHNESSSGFAVTSELVEVCSSGALVVADEELIDHENRRWLVVYADTSRLNWWKTGITAGLQYHVLVLENALERIRNDNSYSNAGKNRRRKEATTKTTNDAHLEESVLLCVDTTSPPFLPPPLGVFKGMTQLLQKAYPDRIHKIFVGPVSPWLRALYERIRPFLKPRSRDKIVLLGEVPSMEFLARWQSHRA
mmetsp:Transcript_21924/g.52178  ORF Transcript_21924/g.52178 Transcript_21924/m.52178 type:complete len:364 (-) Transcript_21924:649-1740(-)